MIFLDYRSCGSEGEPRVVHIAQEADYKITPLADHFETFIRGLFSEDELAFEAEEAVDPFKENFYEKDDNNGFTF